MEKRESYMERLERIKKKIDQFSKPISGQKRSSESVDYKENIRELKELRQGIFLELKDKLNELEKKSGILDFKIESHRKLTGIIIVAYKKFIRMLIRPYLKYIIRRQNDFNKEILNYFSIELEIENILCTLELFIGRK